MNPFLFPKENRKTNALFYFGTAFFALLCVHTVGIIPVSMLVLSRVASQDAEYLEQLDITSLFTNNEYLVVNMIPFVVGFLVLIIIARSIHKRTVLSFVTSRISIDWKRFAFAFIIWGTMLGSLFLIQFTTSPTALQWNFEPNQFFFLLLITLFLVPIQTGFEEILFRGFLFQMMGKFTRKGLVVILVNGLLFGSVHLLNPEVQVLGWQAIVFYVMSGVFAALLTLMDDGIELSWGFHTANNFFGVLVVTNTWQALQTDALFIDHSKPNFGSELLITLLICYPIMVFICAKLFKWTNWKARLLG